VEGERKEGRKEGREGGRARVHDDILVLVLLLSSSFLNQGSPASNLTFILFFPPSLPPSLSEGDELVDPTGRYRLHKSHSARNVGKTVFKEMLIEKKMR